MMALDPDSSRLNGFRRIINLNQLGTILYMQVEAS